MSADPIGPLDAPRAVAKIKSEHGATFADDLTKLLELTWLAGVTEGIDRCKAIVDEVAVP